VQAYLAPPIFAVFVFGVTMRRVNAAGCLAALVIGFALGAFRLIVDTPVTLRMPGFEAGYAPGSLLWIVHNIYFQYYSVVIFLIAALVLLAVSYATAPPFDRQLTGLTFDTVTEPQRRASRASWTAWDVAASFGVLAAIVAVYIYFSG
jgi:SSS family solute:Na+ symporter